MNIGGDDLFLPFPWEAADRDRILQFFRHAWKKGVYEDANSAYRGTIPEALRFAPPTTEFFLYASQEAWTEWESEGAIAANLDTMLHVIGDSKGITLVVDRAHGPFDALWADLMNYVARNRFIPGRGKGQAA